MDAPQNALQRFGSSPGGRKLRFGANATVMTIALIGILVLINVVAMRYHKRWDLTATKDFSLSQQTIQILQGLQQPVQIVGFFGKQDQSQRDDVESRLKEYASHSGQITYRFVDPDVDPVAARTYNITNYGTLVVEGNGKHQQTTGSDENAITSALLKVTQTQQTTVYFLTGHRERAIDSSARDGYSSIKSLLAQDNFIVDPLNLTITSTIPLSNTVLVVADPQTKLQANEEQAISEYVGKGGRLLILGNPLDEAPLGGLLGKAGLSWNNDVLLDQQSALGNPTAPAVVNYPSSQITKDLAGQASVFPSVRTLSQADKPPEGLTISPLLQSSAQSEAATDFANGQVKVNANDKHGPLPFGFSVEGPIGAAHGPKARLIVIGDADFASDGDLTTTQGNGALFRNAVAWLAAQDQLIALPDRAPVDRSIFLTNDQSRLVFYGDTLGIPLLVLVAGVFVWSRRR